MIIREIRSNQKSFRAVRFGQGANVVLADRSAASAKKDTRNGLGKSTLLAIIGYCLGGSKTETLEKPELKGWTFSLDGEHGGRPFSISRSIDEPGVVEVGPGSELWPAGAATTTTLSGAARIKLDEYKLGLGRIMFGLDPDAARQPHHPTFRSLASYRMRQGGRHGGYYSPFQSHRAQGASDLQANNAYLIGLDWRLVAELAHARDYQRRLKALEREAKDGILSDAIGGVGELEALVVRLEYESQREEEAIRAFRVHEKYAELEEEADGLTKAMHGLTNARSVQAKILEGYRQSTRQESEVSPDHVLEIYEKSGVLLADSVRQRLDDAREFHKLLVMNRREYLETEMGRLEEAVLAKGLQIDGMGEKRAKIMKILDTHGAIEELVEMQARHKDTVERRADASSRLESLREIGRKRSALDRKMVRLRERAESDFEAHRDERRRAILAFDRYSKMLYSAPGSLSIDIVDGAYRFGVEIEGSSSKGIDKMKVFCYDFALASLWAGRPRSPGFLAHDSEIFDGVDERQVALALQIAAKESERLGVQYICAINSDAVPRSEFGRGFDFDSRVAVTLTDKGDDGGLLGIRF